MTITELTIVGTRGTDKRPCSGSVGFSDGAAYDWFFEPTIDGDGELLFATSRQRGRSIIHFRFRSPKRAAALRAVLATESKESV